MKEQSQTTGQIRPVQFALIAANPIVFAVLIVLFHQAPATFLWFGLGLSIVALLLVRLLSGFAILGQRRLRFGSSKPLHVWQTPVLWVPVAVAAVLMVFWWFVA
jgi:hypothetical protein